MIASSVVHVSPPFFACGFQENWEVRKTSRKSMRTRGMQAFFAWKMDYRIYMDLILNASNKCAIFKHSQNASHDFLAFAKVLFFMEILKVGGVFEECKLHQHKIPTQDSWQTWEDLSRLLYWPPLFWEWEVERENEMEETTWPVTNAFNWS